jgi:hypothetical protein
MSGELPKKTFEECDAATRFRWAMKYLVGVLTIVFLVAVAFWVAYENLPIEFVMLCNFYLIAGVWVCNRDKRVAAHIDGTWNMRGWCRQIYWWMWWPYFVYLKVAHQFKR